MRTSKGFKTVAALMLSSALMTASYAPLANAEPLDPETMLAERTNPAMQLVTATYSATVQMKSIGFSGEGVDLIRRAWQKRYYGELTSDSDAVEYIFTRAARDPKRYFATSGELQARDYTLQGLGSGFVVTGDGYLVTARHVVTGDRELKQEFARLGAADFAAQEARLFVKANAKYDLTDDTINAIKEAMTAYSRTIVKVKVSAPKVSVILGVASADGSRIGKVQPAEVVYRSSPELQADIALVRIRQANMPTVSMASKSLRQGAPVHINCFPFDATFIKGMSEAAQLTPTMSSGRITALKQTEGGIELMQTDAQASRGCSGGAAIDNDGNVVGVLVSGAVNGNGASVGEFYLMPTGVVKEALQTRNVVPEVSLTTREYDQALADYSKDYYKRALENFRDVMALYPAHAYVSKYVSDSQAAISQGKDKTPKPLPIALLVGGGAAAVVVVTGLILLLLIRRRRNSASGPQPAVQTWGSGNPAGTPSAGTDQWLSGNGWAQSDKGFSTTAPNGVSVGVSTGGPELGPPGGQWIGPGRE
jgi:serine protease Do